MQINKKLFKNTVTFVESIIYRYDEAKTTKSERGNQYVWKWTNVLILKDYLYLFGRGTDLKLSSYQRADQASQTDVEVNKCNAHSFCG